MLITEFLRGVLLIAQLIVNINKESFSPKIHYNDLWVIGHQCLKEKGALNPTTTIVIVIVRKPVQMLVRNQNSRYKQSKCSNCG
ncbi:hypothetical protein L1987_56568 [Smallanthus sonchifolius]|uniref:Uncharacterized protein n=1 Tax=Smallanthus sonchifolius TaxID=185202 RepID=A0ACB9EDH6_9ASTR|nr:hypothetical protein L1987_56568 [Smallanthus sonchifolius]